MPAAPRIPRTVLSNEAAPFSAAPARNLSVISDPLLSFDQHLMLGTKPNYESASDCLSLALHPSLSLLRSVINVPAALNSFLTGCTSAVLCSLVQGGHSAVANCFKISWSSRPRRHGQSLITQALRLLKVVQKPWLLWSLIVFIFFTRLGANAVLWNSLPLFQVLRHLISIKVERISCVGGQGLSCGVLACAI